jgi:putative transposase
MSHRYPSILIHCVFSTKERRDLIPQEMLPRLTKYFAESAAIMKSLCSRRGDVEPFSLADCASARRAGSEGVQVLKANSSRWLREHGLDFSWQEAYRAFSVSSSNKDAVTDYIQHQAEHHRKRWYCDVAEIRGRV